MTDLSLDQFTSVSESTQLVRSSNHMRWVHQLSLTANVTFLEETSIVFPLSHLSLDPLLTQVWPRNILL